MARPFEFTVQDFLAAIPGSNGIISHIASKVHCDWHTARSYIDDNPVLTQAYQDEKESALDRAENAMHSRITVDQDDKMIRFYLSRIGRARGYGERQDVNVSGKLDTAHTLDLESLDVDTLAALLAAVSKGEIDSTE